MKVLVSCLVYFFFFFLIAVSIWRDGCWSRKSYWYDPVARFILAISLINGLISLIGVFVGLVEICNG